MSEPVPAAQQLQDSQSTPVAGPSTLPAGASPSTSNPPPQGSNSSPAAQSQPIQNGQLQGRRVSGELDEQRKLDMIRGMDPAKLNNIRNRLIEMQNQGLTKESSSELRKLVMIVELYNKARAQQATPTTAAPQVEPSSTPATTFTGPPSSSAPMNPAQAAQLRAQAQAYQQLSHNQPVPPYLLAAAQGAPSPGVAGMAHQVGINGIEGKAIEKTVDAVVSHSAEQNIAKQAETSEQEKNGSRASSADEKITTPPSNDIAAPSGPPYAMEFDENSLIYPYNAYTDPMSFAVRKFGDEVANPINKMQRMMVPSVMPKGLDPYLLMEERNRYIETRMAWRMKELEEMSAIHGMGENGAKDIDGVTNGQKETSLGIRARIELMSLRLLGKQRLLKEDMVRAMYNATAVPADRNQFRRFRNHTLRDARATETAERRQRTEREQRGKQRHLAYINSICEHGRQIIETGISTPKGSSGEKMRRLGRSMLKMHNDVEKEEQKRLEKLAKDRLRALKADDEDAYLALLGEAKDSRIGHLLKQTDSYLETLANAVRDQQNDDIHKDYAHLDVFETEDGPASEAMFGAKRQDGEEEGAESKAGKVDYYAVAHKTQEKVHGQASMLSGGTLKDYQVKGLQWMISLYNNRLNGILADEMGLGKTIQTISLITYLIEKKRQPGPFIVIVPLSTLTNWTLEFERWAPTVRTVILKGSPTARKECYPRLRAVDFQVCLTTYEYIIKERPLLSRIKWIHMIIDEGHRMKNVKSKLSQTLNEFYSTRYRLILTGTPLQNNLPELWALLNFVLPKIFNSVKSFDEWFSAPFANTGGEKLEMNEEEQLLVVKRLHKVLRPFLLRRLKKDVESELPDKVEKVIYTKMSALQWALYDNVKKYKMLPTDTNKKKNRSLQNAIMQLRKICNHPFVFPEVEEDFAVGNNIDEQIVRTSGKFELLDRILPKLFATGHRVLIFFQMTEIMTIIADFFDWRGWKYCRLDGSTKADDRQTLLSTFNDPESPYQVFILSTRAGGLGLNLQSADTVIIYDTDWNPHADLQAQDRAHRIGQKKEVRVLRLISSKTVEELVLERAQKKLELDGKVIQAGKFDEITTGAEYEALLAKVFENQGEDETEEVNELEDDELNELLARGDHELEIFSKMDKDREAAKKADWKASGSKAPLPAALMDQAELPAFYRRDLGAELAQALYNEEESGRGRRAKAEVRYTDGLTDEQWLNAMDASDDDVDDAADRKRERTQRKQERKRINAELEAAEADGKPLSIKVKPIKLQDEVSVQDEDEEVAPIAELTKKGKKRGRPSKSATPSVQGDELPSKKRKIGAASDEEISLMRRMYDETNNLKSETGEMLNTFFIKPVDRKAYPDYYQLIAQPIAMIQIKRKIGTPGYSIQAFRADMHLLWANAKTYNQEESWVYNAADDMQEFFDNLWNEEYPKLDSASNSTTTAAPVNPIGSGSALLRMKGMIKAENAGNAGAPDSPANQSGTSTPMFKGPSAKLPTKIKINLGASKRRTAIVDSPDDSDSGDDY